MNLKVICKYFGLLSGAIAILLVLAGVIGFLKGEFLNVVRFSNFFWFANTFFLMAIFGIVTSIACKDKSE